MNLYEINKRLNQILDIDFYIDEETGEVFGVEDLDNLDIERNEKLEGLICYIKSKRAEAEAIKTEIVNLKSREDGINKKIESLTKYLALNCPEGFESSKGKLSYRKSESVEVDEDALDKAYITEKVEYRPNKTEIKKAIKSGINVVGAWLVEKSNPQIK